MPKGTFEKIAPEKKDRLIREAARLFAERGFSGTDVGEVAARAGIAKGSLYNYFESKDDLYISVCRDALERSRQAVWGGIDSAWDAARQLEAVFRAGVDFARAHPEFVALYLNISSSGMDRFAEELSAEVEKATAARLKDLLTQHMENEELDIDATAFSINSLYIITLASLISPHYKIRLREYFDIPKTGTDEDVDRHIDRVVDIAKGIIGAKGRNL